MKRIDEEAKRLYERVMRRYREREVWDRRPLSEMIDEELSSYNSRVRKVIEPMIYDELRGVFGDRLPEVVPTPARLSEMLYRNAAQAAAGATALLWSAQRSRETVRELAMRLYEGYGFRDREVLEVLKRMPGYLERQMKRPGVQRSVAKRVSRLRTSPLRAAYNGVLEAVKKQSDTALHKAAKVSLEEKARYYAKRIAVTESYRSDNLARAKKYLEDPEVELVRYRMSSRHPMVDICDYYAHLDVGYGPGIVPKDQMIALPLHPHCRCVYDPYYRRVKKRKVRDPEAETMARFREDDQRRILGSWSAWRRWKNGTPAVEIWNAARPGYPVRPVGEVLYNGGMEGKIKQFLEEINSGKIKQNSVRVGQIDESLVRLIEKNEVEVLSKDISLTVRAVKHILRDSKARAGKGIPKEHIVNIPEYLAISEYILLDTHPKHRNIVYVYSDNGNRFYKIVVCPKEGIIKTCGIFNLENLKMKEYKRLK